MKNYIKNWFIASAAFTLACGGIDLTVDNNDKTDGRTTEVQDEVAEALEAGNTVYGGLGSYWTVVKTPSGNFTMTRREERDADIDGTVHGSYTTLESGFMELTVTHGTGMFAEVPEGLLIYGVEIPNTLLVIKMPHRDQLLYMPAIGNCPTEQVAINAIWTRTQGELLWNDRDVVHAMGVIDPQAGSITGQGYFFGDGLNEHRAREAVGSYSCERGELTVTGNDVTKDGILTESGVGNLGGALLVPQDATVVQADLQGDYVGVAYGPADEDHNRSIKALTASFGADGTDGTVRVVTNAEATAIESEHNLSITAPAEGAVPGSFLYSAIGDLSVTDRGLGVMLVARDIGGSGKTFIVAHGQRPEDSRPYFLFLVEK